VLKLIICLQITEDQRNQFRLEITQRFDQFKETFKQGKENYIVSLNGLMDSIHVSLFCLTK